MKIEFIHENIDLNKVKKIISSKENTKLEKQNIESDTDKETFKELKKFITGKDRSSLNKNAYYFTSLMHISFDKLIFIDYLEDYFYAVFSNEKEELILCIDISSCKVIKNEFIISKNEECIVALTKIDNLNNDDFMKIKMMTEI